MADESEEVYKEAYEALAASLVKSSTHHIWIDTHKHRQDGLHGWTLGLVTSHIPLIHAVNKSGGNHVVVVFEDGEVRIRNFESHPYGDIISKWELSDPECFSDLEKYFSVINEAYPQAVDPIDIIVCLTEDL